MTKEYIERETLISRINGMGYHEQIKNNLLFIARTIPAADVVEVVRCKDCFEFETGVVGWCNHWQTGSDGMGFCGYGERREDE